MSVCSACSVAQEQLVVDGRSLSVISPCVPASLREESWIPALDQSLPLTRSGVEGGPCAGRTESETEIPAFPIFDSTEKCGICMIVAQLNRASSIARHEAGGIPRDQPNAGYHPLSQDWELAEALAGTSVRKSTGRRTFEA